MRLVNRPTASRKAVLAVPVSPSRAVSVSTTVRGEPVTVGRLPGVVARLTPLQGPPVVVSRTVKGVAAVVSRDCTRT